MKLLLSTLFVVGTLGFAPAAFAVDKSIDPLCRAGGSEAAQRPGGYCDQIASNKSLVPTGGGAPTCLEDPCLCKPPV
jgi:hypothetical protein